MNAGGQVPLLITDSAHQMMGAFTADSGGLMRGGVRMPDGRWRVMVDADVVEGLNKIHVDPSTAIIMLCERASR